MNRPSRAPEPGRTVSALDDVARRLRENADPLAAAIVEKIIENVPTYAAVTDASLRHSLLQHIDTAARSLTLGEVPERVRDVSVAATRARSGIPIEHVLLAIRMSFQALREFAIQAAVESGTGSGMQLEAVRILWEVNDLVSREYAVAHREEDLEMARTAESARVELVRRLLVEGVSTPDMGMHAGSFGLVAGTRYRAFRARTTDGTPASAMLQEILRWATAHRLGPVGAVIDGDAAGVFTDTGLLRDGPTMGIGPARELHTVHESFRVASQLLEVGLQFGRSGPQTLPGLSLRVAVATEHRVGDELVDRILGPLLDQGDFGLDLVASLDAYLAAEMNTAAAAERLVVHPNTVRYRLQQVKRLSGLTLKSAQEISEVWWALRRHEWMLRTGYR